MNEKLQQAIVAARNGQSTKAQLLLAETLKEDSDQTQAWFLLSNLVDSEQKKIVYLKKAIALDPQHSMAKQALARLQDESVGGDVEELAVEMGVFSEESAFQDIVPETAVISEGPADYIAQEQGDTVPEWLAEEEGLPLEQHASMQAEDVPDLETDSELELPDWLQEEADETWVEDPATGEASATLIPQQKRKPAEVTPYGATSPDHTKKKQQDSLTRILYALVVVAVIIFAILLYLVWTTL